MSCERFIVCLLSETNLVSAQGSLGETIREVRPTCFLGVPRVFEKMEAAMRAKGAETTGLKRSIAKWAKGVGLKYYNNVQHG